MSETSEKARADEIRRRVEEIFGYVTESERELSERQNDLFRSVDMLPGIRDFFDLTVDLVKELHKSEENAPQLVVFDEDLREMIRDGLLQRVYATFPAWHVAASLTDSEILAAAEQVSDILSAPPPYTAGQVERLEALFAKGRNLDFVMPMGDSRLNYLAAVGNLRYYLVACASCAKGANSFAAGRCFLKAASLLATGSERLPPHFKEDEADEILDLFEEGLSELLLALDYQRLTDWGRLLAEAREREVKDAAQ